MTAGAHRATAESHLAATVLGSKDPQRLARFYQRVLGWTITYADDAWVTLRPPDGSAGLSFQLETDLLAPKWPDPGNGQQMHMHLDIHVGDLDEGVRQAVAAGATPADHQPQSDVRVMRDPDGHLFCLFAG